jgi:hypothetical protein
MARTDDTPIDAEPTDSLHGEPDAPARQKRAPSYDIQWRNDEGAWEDLAMGIEAKRDLDAIRKVTDHLPADDPKRWGSFKTSRHGEVRVRNRVKKIIPETIADDWS